MKHETAHYVSECDTCRNVKALHEARRIVATSEYPGLEMERH
jgi:hypothetical protein